MTDRLSEKWLRIAALVLALGGLVVLILSSPVGLRASGDNVVANGDFESGTTGWTCKLCTLNAGTPAESGTAGQLTTTKATGRGQIFQKNITLQAGMTYELRFWARSANGSDLRVVLMQQVSPRANYGIKNQAFDLTTDGQEFAYTFTTTGFSGTVSDALLRFQADKGKGLQYSIDNISLTATDAPPPDDDDDDMSDEILVFNRGSKSTPFVVTRNMSGFVEDKPPTGAANANWVTGQYAGFANGTLYYRARIINIPQNQLNMKFGFCFWENKYANEECRGQVLDGVPGNELTWSHRLDDMWVKSPINWANPRTKHGFIVRNQHNKPVSAKKNWNWNGENPDHWYPMEVHYTVVLVRENGEFSGWDNYGW